jgi:hypothetical protein
MSMTDADGQLTDPLVYASLNGAAHRDRAMRLFAQASSGPRDVDLTLEWSFSPPVAWHALPPVVLDRICDFCNIEDVCAMMSTCAAWRDRLQKNVTIQAVTKVWMEAWERRKERALLGRRCVMEEEARRRREARCDFFCDHLCLAMPWVSLVASLGSQLALGIVGIAYFALLRKGLSVVPSCDAEASIYGLLYASCALLLLNALLLGYFHWRLFQQTSVRPWFAIVNTLGLLSNAGIAATSAAVLRLCLSCVANPELGRQAYQFCSCTTAMGAFQLVMGAWAAVVGWTEAYRPLLRRLCPS